MSRLHFQLAGYGACTLGFMALGICTDRQADTLPFVTQAHMLPTPPKTYIFDQRTEGGERVRGKGQCATHARVLLRSELPLKALQTHYRKLPIKTVDRTSRIMGNLRPASGVQDLTTEWQKYRSDPTVYVIDYVSPGTHGSETFCGQ